LITTKKTQEMSYFQTLPNELNYIIFTYSDFHELYELSKELELYVDYGSLLRVKYPKNYNYLRKYVQLDGMYYYRYLELYGFNDNLEDYNSNIIRRIPAHNRHHQDVYELIAKVYFDVKYPKKDFELKSSKSVRTESEPILKNIFDQFPQDNYKYTVLLEAISQLDPRRNDELTKLIFEPMNLHDINFDNIQSLLDNQYYEFSEIYVLLLAIKYKFTLDEFENINYNDDIFSRDFSRDAVLDNIYINYTTKVINKLNSLKTR